MVDEKTVQWREKFTEKNDREHKSISKTLAKLDKNTALMAQEVKMLNDTVKLHIESIEKENGKIDGRVERLEKYKEAKQTQLRMANWIAILAAGVVAFILNAKKLFGALIK